MSSKLKILGIHQKLASSGRKNEKHSAGNLFYRIDNDKSQPGIDFLIKSGLWKEIQELKGISNGLMSIRRETVGRW